MFVSVTTDIWSLTSNNNYMSITAHIIKDSELIHLCLKVIPFPETSHTSEELSQFNNEILIA